MSESAKDSGETPGRPDERPISSLPMANAGLSRLVAERLRLAGVDLAPLLKKAGITKPEIDDPNRRIANQRQIAFLAAAAEALDDDLLGLRLAENFDCREIGLLYYAAASSATLGEAMRRAARYSRVTNEAILLKLVDGEAPVLRFSYAGVARHTDMQQMEFLMVAALRICRVITGRRLVPRMVSIAHLRSAVPPEASAFFGTSVEFGAAHDEIALPEGAFDLPSIGADPHLSKIVLKYCDECLAQRSDARGPFRARVENAMAPLLPHASARADAVARELGMSERTLGRKLAEEETSFNEVLQDLRSELAARYLEDPRLPVSRIAWLLGFEEVSSFSHAFKRWTGKSPREMRAV
ncbi:MAG: AraC family transcriptional regulator ligand-binding domain-containing protein [Beijerinckiaceae bacterium]